MDFFLDNMSPSDWDQVCRVYGEGIATGHATFEAGAPAWEEWDARHLPRPRLVARAGDSVLGWGALSPVSDRCVYAGVAEVSLYVGATYRGEGVGSSLLAALIKASEEAGIWTLQGGIFPENAASLALVKKHGFREVGNREHLGRMTLR